ncbi:hypothetical protein LCGC14_0781490 [marine sediment metagenome]|uniref:Uncharacterized protein n=1 Tax=marine sediment metagenome TaxID=412755 RepID=A0A0F9QF72_9ZZZZ
MDHVAVAKYLEYAKERGRWWAAKHPLHRDDILATAIYALVKVFERPKYLQYPKGLISRAVDNQIVEFLRNNYLIKIPHSEIKRRKEAEESFETLPRAFLAGDIKTAQFEGKDYYSFHWHKDYDLWDLGLQASTEPSWKKMHAEDILLLLHLSPFEDKLIALRIQGFSFSEISTRLNKAKSTLHAVLENLRNRYLIISADPNRNIRRPDEK